MVAIVPLEVWDVVVGGRSLFARRSEPGFFDSLAAAVLALRAGDAVRENGGRLAAAPWDAIAIVGGGVDVTRARVAFAAAGIELDLVSGDPFFSVSTAFEALRETGGDAAVVDVGQTAIKALGPGGRVHQPRGSDGGVTADRDAFAREVARALSASCAGHPPVRVVMGLPCEVETRDGRCVLGESTYPTGDDGDALVRDVLGRCGFAGTPVRLVNDAVLAAEAVMLASRGRDAKSRLVLTIGHGVGGALVKAAIA